MRAPSCLTELKPYCSDTLLSILAAHDKPIPYILKLLDQQCTHRECSHHVLSDDIKFKGGGNGYKYIETKYVHECAGCMCLIERPASAVEIAEIYGVYYGAIEACEWKALNKMRRNKVMSEIGEEVRSGVTGKRTYIKRVRSEKSRFVNNI